MKKLLIILITLISLSAYGQIDTVNVGTAGNAGDGDPLRTAFLKVNDLTNDYNRISLYNILANEMAILDGALWSTAEGNYLVGVSSAIQTQLNGKQSTLTNSAGLRGALSDETGTGLSVFGTSPTFTTDITTPSLILNGTTLTEFESFSDIALPKEYSINAQTGTTYTLVLTDATKLVTCTNGSAIAMTVPPNSGVAFPTGTQLKVAQLGAGTVTITAGGGVTILSLASDVTISGQNGVVELIKTATNTWLLFGDL